MIKKILLPLIAIVLMSSCANKFSLQKRKYNKGFYFANSKNNNKKRPELIANKTEVKNLSQKTYLIPKENENVNKADIKALAIQKTILNAYVSNATKKEIKRM